MTQLLDPIYVKDERQFAEAMNALAKESLIAVDTESNSLYAYREQVCLIQFSTPSADYLIDPLAIEDISPLGSIFADVGVEKIFHAAEYDLLCLKRDFSFAFENIFDTMVAARICGIEKVGLGNMLQEMFGVHLEKRFQKADWGKRPLPMKMLAYARMDTHYLIDLREKLIVLLERKNRQPIAEEDFKRLARVNGTPPGPIDTDIWRINGTRDLSPIQAAVLQELVNYRDKKSQDFNRPPFKVIGEKILLEIAVQSPTTINEMYEIPSVPEKIVRRHRKGLLAAVHAGLESEGLKRPPRQHFKNGFPERLEALKQWRKSIAFGLGVESDVVLPRDIMLAIATENPRNKTELANLMESTPWRLERYGHQIQQSLTKL
ncbi:MAG: HRDC domain-containing protein [Anaerolineae bacterium]|nr:HRDC domain-containing protein [Anaerolineae bacterium]